MHAINYYRLELSRVKVALCPECAAFYNAVYVQAGSDDLVCDECGAHQQKQIGLCQMCASSIGLGDQLVEGPDTICDECGSPTRFVYVYDEHYAPKTVVISVKGGVVIDVQGLPPDWTYVLIDEDVR